MKLYFAGAEVPGWRNLLHDEQIPAVSLSFVGLSARVKKLNEWHLADKFPATPGFRQELLLDSGAYSLNKEDSKYTDADVVQLAAAYFTFVANNIDRIDVYTEFDVIRMESAERVEMREALAQIAPDKFMPIWHHEDGINHLDFLAETYDRVGVLQPAKDAMNDLSPILRSAAAKTKLHGVSMTRMASMKAIPWDSVGSTTWLNPGQYGETFVWTGNEMKWYPVKYREQARKRHRTLFDSQGFDPVKIARDATDERTPEDRKEVLRLSLFAWSKFVEDINLRGHDEPPVATSGRGAPRTEVALVEREKTLLPILSWGTGTTDEGEEEQQLGTGSSNLMQCNTCFARDKCPKFTPDADCAYKIPVQIRTTTQRTSARKALLEMQMQRVAMMRMFEMFEGGYADPNLSGEISRLQKMLKEDADAERSANELEITIRGKGDSNFMADMFGGATEAKVNALAEPISAAQMLEASGVVDAEVIDE